MSIKVWALVGCMLLLAACATVSSTITPKEADKSLHHSQIPLEKMDVQFLYLASQQALAQGHVVSAMGFLDALLKKDSEAVQPRLELVGLCLASGQGKLFKRAHYLLETMPVEAVARLEGAFKRDYQLLYARSWVVRGDAGRAVPILQSLLKADSQHKAARLLLISIYVGQNNFKQAHLLLAEAIAVRSSPQLLEMQVQLYLRQGDMQRAEQLLLAMQQQFPADEAVVLQRSQVAESRGDTAKAENILKSFIAKYGDKAQQTPLMLSELYVRNSRLDEAASVLLSFLSVAVEPLNVYLSLGKVYYQQEAYLKSTEMFEQALELGHQNPDQSAALYFYTGVSLEAAHEWEKSVAYYVKVPSLHVLYLDAQLRLVNIDLTNKKYDQAESRLNKLQVDFLDEPRVYEMLSSLRLRQEDYEQALAESARALDLGFSAVLLFNRAVAFEALKQFEQLDETLNRLLRQEPKHAEALNFYGYSLADRGVRLEEALVMVNKALQLRPKDGYYLDSKAWVLFKQTAYVQAISIQLRALKLVPKDALMQEHLGDMYWQAGEQDKARKRWQKALGLGHKSADQLRKKIAHGLM